LIKKLIYGWGAGPITGTQCSRKPLGSRSFVLNLSRAEHNSAPPLLFAVFASPSRVKLSFPAIPEEEAAMTLEGFPLDPSPTDVVLKGGTEDEEDISEYWDGIPMTSAEMAEEMSAIARGEKPLPEPQPQEWTEEHERMEEAESQSDVAMDFPWGPLFPEDEELRLRGILETMADALPEMDIIIENEGIM
jgi:hypothetical protein